MNSLSLNWKRFDPKYFTTFILSISFFLASYAYFLFLFYFCIFTYVKDILRWRKIFSQSSKRDMWLQTWSLTITQGWQMIFHRVSRQIVVRLTEDLVRLNVVLNLLINLNLSSKCVKRNHGCFFIILFILLLIFAGIFSPFVNESEVN